MDHPLAVRTEPPERVPAGWYTVAAAAALAPGGLQAARIAGIDLVVYRTADGVVHCVNDRCPHLGGRLTKGGRVEDGLLVCPVHYFAYDRDGACRRTGYGSVAPRACTQPWRCLERNGLVMVWYHPGKAAPDWEPEALDASGHLGLRIWRDPVAAPAQLIMEGIADQGHLRTVHGYDEVARTAAFDTAGPALRTAYRFDNPTHPPRWLPAALRRRLQDGQEVRFDYCAWGLGYSVTDVEIPALGLGMRTFVNPAPVAPDRCDLWHGMALRRIGDPGRISAALKPLPRGLVERLMQAVLRRGYLKDIHDDMRLWESLDPLARPALAPGDGPVAAHRRWAAQFYG